MVEYNNMYVVYVIEFEIIIFQNMTTNDIKKIRIKLVCRIKLLLC